MTFPYKLHKIELVLYHVRDMYLLLYVLPIIYGYVLIISLQTPVNNFKKPSLSTLIIKR